MGVFKCGLSLEHKHEFATLIWINNRLCWFGFAIWIFQGILGKLKFSRYFAMREVTIATYKKSLFDDGDKKKRKSVNTDINHKVKNDNMNRKKKRRMDEKTKLERKIRGYLALNTFSYEATRLFPWICAYLSVQLVTSSTYYVKTFASTSFYQTISKDKHKKNRFILKVIAITTLMFGICCSIGNDTYFESVKYAKRWFMPTEQYSIESYQSRKKAQKLLKQDRENQLKKSLAIINEAHDNDIDITDVTPGGHELKDEEIVELLKNQSDSMDRNTSINTTDEESDQIEGEGATKTRRKAPKYTLIQEKLINGNYQQETDMLLSTRYFHQKAHDLFEYVTEICVFLEDKFLNALVIPVY